MLDLKLKQLSYHCGPREMNFNPKTCRLFSSSSKRLLYIQLINEEIQVVNLCGVIIKLSMQALDRYSHAITLCGSNHSLNICDATGCSVGAITGTTAEAFLTAAKWSEKDNLRSNTIDNPFSPVLKTQTITISDVTNSLRGTVAYKDMPLLHTETKTITYESAQ
ncbi:hypothetical protein INR49_027366, partial [Caranx melampygus]